MDRMDRAKLDAEEFTDQNGKLSAFVGGGGAIWAPLGARIGSLPDMEGNLVECVVYPVPDSLKPPINNNPIKAEDLRVIDLNTWGWHKKEDSANVLEDFIRLAEGTPEAIRRFVVKWGPLWLCTRHHNCFWVPTLRPHFREGCEWIPAEPLDEFRSRARAVRVAFDIAALLRKNKPVPAALWEAFGWSGDERGLSLWAQRFFFTSTINGYLTMPGGPSLYVYWNNQTPQLVVDTGLGFLRVVWLMIAQCLTGARGLYHCDECGAPYIRKRKPQVGRLAFCPTCGKNGQGSKRFYERNKRVRRRDSSTQG